MTRDQLEHIADVPYVADSPYIIDNREFRLRLQEPNTCKAQKSLERRKEKYELSGIYRKAVGIIPEKI